MKTSFRSRLTCLRCTLCDSRSRVLIWRVNARGRVMKLCRLCFEMFVTQGSHEPLSLSWAGHRRFPTAWEAEETEKEWQD